MLTQKIKMKFKIKKIYLSDLKLMTSPLEMTFLKPIMIPRTTFKKFLLPKLIEMSTKDKMKKLFFLLLTILITITIYFIKILSKVSKTNSKHFITYHLIIINSPIIQIINLLTPITTQNCHLNFNFNLIKINSLNIKILKSKKNEQF